MAYLQIKDISKKFGANEVLKNINLDVRRRSFCVILGPSGCGKSTLLNIVAGLERPDTGSIFLEGEDVTHMAPHKRDIAMVFQNYALYPHLSVYENLAFGLRARNASSDDIDKKVRQTSRILSIEDKLDSYPRQLSGGQRQRVATGRAIVRDPRLFLFDEPLSNLDARLRIEVRKEFLRLQNELEITSLYVTHDQSEALALGDDIVVIKDSLIQQQANPYTLYNEPENLFVARFIGTPPMNIVKGTINSGEGLRFERGRFSLDITGKHPEKLASKEGEEVYLGLRPAHIDLAGSGVEAIVEFSELSGEEYLTYMKVEDGLEIRALIGDPVKDGEKVRFRIDPEKMYFFTSSGERIK
ncbi:MAG: ATP-binding cassette domain-containing protein [Candidatus Omnitrophica bacterium]|nr:ATP-binding cassette domain-containing protein [Candidatus Omnitrophota bacterium]